MIRRFRKCKFLDLFSNFEGVLKVSNYLNEFERTQKNTKVISGPNLVSRTGDVG